MNVIPGEVIIEPATNRPVAQSQPIEALAGLETPLDDAQVRQAIASAEANNQDPQTITMNDLAQGQVNTPPAQKSVEVPPKFLKPDGAVDVDKIQASTRQLDEALQNREPIPVKTVDDYMREYQEKEKLFRSGTVPKAQAQPMAPIPPAVPLTENPNYEDIVRRDFAQDPLMTMTRLMDLALQAKFAPLEQKEKSEQVRSQLQALAAKDSRVLREDVFSAIQAKLQNDPDLWKLKQPHRAAWLEVKEELRLGELPQGAQAQPSRPLSPVLGGGSPPSAPSSSVPSPNGNVNLDSLDLRDKNQEALGDEAIRRALMGHRG